MSILDDYQKQIEIDESTFDYGDCDEDVKKRIQEIKDDPNDMANIFKKFNSEFPKYDEYRLGVEKCLTDDPNVKIIVRHAYCPSCGKEIISKVPVMFNPYTHEKIAKYECECGFKANLDFSYPRLVFLNEKGDEIKVFND